VLGHTCGLPLRRPRWQSASIWVLGDDQRSLALRDVLVHEVVEVGPGGTERATYVLREVQSSSPGRMRQQNTPYL
jgi:hypothetical protein